MFSKTDAFDLGIDDENHIFVQLTDYEGNLASYEISEFTLEKDVYIDFSITKKEDFISLFVNGENLQTIQTVHE